MIVDVRDPDNPRRLLLRYDTDADRVQVKQRGEPARWVSIRDLRSTSGAATTIDCREPSTTRRAASVR